MYSESCYFRIVRETRDPKKIHEALEEMANAEGVILKPYEDDSESQD